MVKKKLRWAIVPVVVAIAFVGLSSFTEESEDSYGTCDKSNSNPCKITKKDGTVILNSTGAWVSS